MTNKKVLLHLSDTKDPTLLSASLKAYLIDKDASLTFLLEGKDKDKVLFSGYEGLKAYDGKEDFDIEIIKDGIIGENRLTYLIHKADETRAYLLLLKSYDEAAIEKAIRHVSHIFHRDDIKAVMLSEDFPIDNRTLIAKRASQKEIFQLHEPLLILSEKDFSLLQDHFSAFTSLFFEEKEKKKSLFSDIGSFFFKNYTHSEKAPALSDSLAFYEILLEREKPTFHLLREGDSNDYRNLFTTLEEYRED